MVRKMPDGVKAIQAEEGSDCYGWRRLDGRERGVVNDGYRNRLIESVHLDGEGCWMSKLFSYVVDHDHGYAPNPMGRYCTLAKCKYGRIRRNIVELAMKGDWIVGTGGANFRKSSGHGTIVYAMRVDEKLSLGKYYDDPRFKGRADANHNLPRTGHFALISRHFYYFGRNAIKIPKRFLEYPLEKENRGFLNHFDEDFIEDFTHWLETSFKVGIHGPPCKPHSTFHMPTCPSEVRRKPCPR